MTEVDVVVHQSRHMASSSVREILCDSSKRYYPTTSQIKPLKRSNNIPKTVSLSPSLSSSHHFPLPSPTPHSCPTHSIWCFCCAPVSNYIWRQNKLLNKSKVGYAPLSLFFWLLSTLSLLSLDLSTFLVDVDVLIRYGDNGRWCFLFISFTFFWGGNGIDFKRTFHSGTSHPLIPLFFPLFPSHVFRVSCPRLWDENDVWIQISHLNNVSNRAVISNPSCSPLLLIVLAIFSAQHLHGHTEGWSVVEPIETP